MVYYLRHIKLKKVCLQILSSLQFTHNYCPQTITERNVVCDVIEIEVFVCFLSNDSQFLSKISNFNQTLNSSKFNSILKIKQNYGRL